MTVVISSGWNKCRFLNSSQLRQDIEVNYRSIIANYLRKSYATTSIEQIPIVNLTVAIYYGKDIP